MSDSAKGGELQSLGSSAAVDELDEFDLLRGEGGGQARPVLDTNIVGTAKAFNTRIQRLKKEQEEAQGIATRQTRARHTQMFNALVSIRKSLRDITRIDLGERFSFQLVADDWFGWPRIVVKLLDHEQGGEEYPQLTVSAHDRKAAGTIEILYDSQQPTEKIVVEAESDLKRLPAVLRKCVRSYLDIVGDIVLQAEQRVGMVAQDSEDDLQTRNISGFENRKEEDSQAALSDDLYEEEFGPQGFLETLPSLDDVEALPELVKK